MAGTVEKDRKSEDLIFRTFFLWLSQNQYYFHSCFSLQSIYEVTDTKEIIRIGSYETVWRKQESNQERFGPELTAMVPWHKVWWSLNNEPGFQEKNHKRNY